MGEVLNDGERGIQVCVYNTRNQMSGAYMVHVKIAGAYDNIWEGR